MLEIKVNIEATAPDLSAAIEKLAVALKGSVVLSPEGVQTQLSGVQVAGNPTVTPASATVESVPAVNTNGSAGTAGADGAGRTAAVHESACYGSSSGN